MKLGLVSLVFIVAACLPSENALGQINAYDMQLPAEPSAWRATGGPSQAAPTPSS